MNENPLCFLVGPIEDLLGTELLGCAEGGSSLVGIGFIVAVIAGLFLFVFN